MKLHEKIQKIMLENKMSIKNLYDIQKSISENPLSLQSIRSIVNGVTFPRYNNLQVICAALGVNLMEVMVDTDLEEICEIPYNVTLNSYSYPCGAEIKYVSSPTCPYSVGLLDLKPGQKTLIEQTDVHSQVKYIKNIVIIKGRLKVNIDGVQYKLQEKGASITFNAIKKHYLENPFSKECTCVITTNPKYF